MIPTFSPVVACVAGGIVSACKVLAEELRIRGENGERNMLQ